MNDARGAVSEGGGGGRVGGGRGGRGHGGLHRQKK
jgi:hypothetical protein